MQALVFLADSIFAVSFAIAHYIASVLFCFAWSYQSKKGNPNCYSMNSILTWLKTMRQLSHCYPCFLSIGQFHVATMLGEHTISLNFPIEIVLDANHSYDSNCIVFAPIFLSSLLEFLLSSFALLFSSNCRSIHSKALCSSWLPSIPPWKCFIISRQSFSLSQSFISLVERFSVHVRDVVEIVTFLWIALKCIADFWMTLQYNPGMKGYCLHHAAAAAAAAWSELCCSNFHFHSCPNFPHCELHQGQRFFSVDLEVRSGFLTETSTLPSPWLGSRSRRKARVRRRTWTLPWFWWSVRSNPHLWIELWAWRAMNHTRWGNCANKLQSWV